MECQTSGSEDVIVKISIGDVVQKRWKVLQKLNYGSFGDVYLVSDSQKPRYAAMKVESASQCQLPVELEIMKRFQGKPHSIDLYAAGVDEELQLNFIAMQLVGDSLSTLRKSSPYDPKRFSLFTSLRLIEQCLEALQHLHGIYCVHRDVKPSNFAIGLAGTEGQNSVFILDFGLAKFFADDQGNHKPERKLAGLRGTIRYCSIGAQNKRDTSRRDDLISLFYVMIEFIKGILPWHYMTDRNEVLRSKTEYGLKFLGGRLFPDIDRFADHIESLKFEDEPDYQLLADVLRRRAKEMSVKFSLNIWDWQNNFAYVEQPTGY